MAATAPMAPMAGPRLISLDEPGLAWAEVVMPASSAPVRLMRLHADPATGASVSLVSFPPGWVRPGTGHYTCAEEFVAFDGHISVSGETHGPGERTFLPSHASRTDSSVAPDGCLAVAWFSARPAWHDGPAPTLSEPDAGDPAAGEPAAGGSVPPGPGMPDSAPPGPGMPGSVLLDAVSPEPVPAHDGTSAVDVLYLDARAWAYVPVGETAPALPGRVLVRPWA